MNILYFTLDDFDSIDNYRSINTDLLREFKKHGHRIYVVSPSERKKGYPTRLIGENDNYILKPRIGNIQKTNTIEKGISTITVGKKLISAIKKYLSNVKFDLILYCTPPITFLSAIQFVKKRDGAHTYLLLKDIFPQNAVDIGMMKEGSLIHRYFSKKEKRLYLISDHIGCMSPANVEYVTKNHPEINPDIVEVCPNSIDVVDKSVDFETRKHIRDKYGVPQDKSVFVYGGNLGKPQGIPFLIKCLRECSDLDNAFFLIVGDGTEYELINDYLLKEKPNNLKLMKQLPKDDYDNMVGACDIGLIFLDHRFTIPNFPSRMLSYMAARLPILACTDTSTDVGKVILSGAFGWWCESKETKDFKACIKEITSSNSNSIDTRKQAAYDYLLKNYQTENAYQIIIRSAFIDY